ncbi:glycosyltransferase [Salinimonas marina]|uniref:Glycosyltransferase n=2 Tax=Salinimonas marina TaxID=2785918 RepID=A0A7S9HEC2_9ALTE|nr:glycosyltransferase [Salinimonas marina]
MYNLLQAFAQHGWQTTFLSAASDSIHQVDLTQINVNSQTVSLNCSSFDHLIESLQPQVVVFDRFMIEEQFSWRVKKVCPQALRVLNTEDLHSLRSRRQQAIKKPQAATTDFTDSMTQRELAAVLRSDLTLVISPAEYDLLSQTFGVPPQQLLYLPLLISAPPGHSVSFEERNGFVFIGNFRHAPNWDAALQLKEQLWPAIRAKMPTAQLSVYGAYPAKKVTNLHNPAQGFHVKGWVEDARAAISQHKVMLAPIRFGAGVKGKLVTAMQCATPSVTTSCGAEGIAKTSSSHGTDGQAGWPGAICDDISQMAEAAVYLHNDVTGWQHASMKCAAIVAAQFDTQTHQRNVESAVTDLVSKSEQHRSGLFLQQLLWHESLRSTQYMSQWIEAKNR